MVAPLSEHYLQWGSFQSIDLPGFLNSGLPGQRSCDTLKYNASIGVQKSSHLRDDLEQIALSLDTNPAVDYGSLIDDPDLKVADIVQRTWARLSGSSVWLPEQRVFLVVTRIVFLGEKQILSAPKASFLRGQIFNENWEHQENYNVKLSGETLTFPLVFDIPTKYEGGQGEYYGPEDPRIILEDNVQGAEPVIIFNMAHERSDWKRAMYTFRPFSRLLNILTIRDTGRADCEKNWAPFFLPSEDLKHKKSAREPNEYIHFVYNFKPLKILKCHLRCGDCHVVFEQLLPNNIVTQDGDDGGSLHGGTNFVPFPIPRSAGVHEDVRVYVAFPRTNVGRQCGKDWVNHYRPEFIVMVSFRGSFHMAFASKALDFGSAILELDEDDDPCDKGRILIPNSISQWDTAQDVMTMTFSVDDKTVQIARIRGLLSFVRGLPQFKGLWKKKGPLKGELLDLMNVLSSWSGDNVRACLVESAVNATLATTELHAQLFPEPQEPKEVDHSMRLSLKKEEEFAQFHP